MASRADWMINALVPLERQLGSMQMVERSRRFKLRFGHGPFLGTQSRLMTRADHPTREFE
jgi:hypothetical protein